MSISVPSAGELNKRITLFRHTDVPSGHVSVVSTDLDIMTVWAKIEPTGSVYWGTVQTEDKASHRIWIRSYAGRTDAASISHGVWVRYKGRKYAALRVTECNGEDKFTLLEVREYGEVPDETLNERIEGSFE